MLASRYLVCLLLALGSPLLATARLISGDTANEATTGLATELNIPTEEEASTRVSRELVAAPPDFSSWMKDIKDTTLVSDITMPGTHDSMAWRVAFLKRDWAKAQDQPLWDQMIGGVRFIDIRLLHDGQELKCVHGSADLDAGFGEVVETVYNFLKAHPTETILMSIKEDDTNAPIGSFSEVVAWYLRYSRQATKGYNGLVFPAELYYNSSAVPTMAQARGKVILVKRFGIGAGDPPEKKALLAGGLDMSHDWADNNKLFSINLSPTNSIVYLQDLYKVTSDGLLCAYKRDRKQQAIEDLMINATKGKRPQDWYFNFVSLANYETCPIWSHAKELDDWLKDKLGKSTYKNKALGVLILDYVWSYDSSKDLVPRIIAAQRPGTWKNAKGHRLA